MAVGDAYVFPGFLTPVLTQLFFPKPPTTFLTCFCRGERRKYAGKKSRLNRESNSQPPGLESDTLTTEPPGRGVVFKQRQVSARQYGIGKQTVLRRLRQARQPIRPRRPLCGTSAYSTSSGCPFAVGTMAFPSGATAVGSGSIL